MSAKAVSEHSGKELLYRHLSLDSVVKPFSVAINEHDDIDQVILKTPWLSAGNVIVYIVFCKLRQFYGLFVESGDQARSADKATRSARSGVPGYDRPDQKVVQREKGKDD